MKLLTNLWTLAALVVGMFFCVCSAAPAAAQGNGCSAMLSLTIPNTEILAASVVPAFGPLPAHCWVIGVTHGEPGSNVGFDVRLPDKWNGKLLFTTRQGYMGSLAPLFNSVVSSGLIRNYATVTTDGGHQGANILDGSFGLNNRPAEIDFGYRGAHLAKAGGTAVISAYYGSAPLHSYYQGCSSSGRYAIQAAEHYPADFDGIIAGSPVVDVSGLVIDEVYIEQAMLAAPLPASKLPVIWKRVTAACDGIDGVVDGLIDDPRNCHFDVSTLLCQSGDATNCLTADEIDTLKKVYTGAFNSAGKQLFPGFAFGGELPDPDNSNGWDAYITGSDSFPALDILLSDQYLRYLAFEPDRPDFDWPTFNFDIDPPAMETMHDIIDPVQDDLRAFGDAGSKMIIYQGWGDIAQSPYRTIQYYQGLRRHVGRRGVEDYARLFMAPGMYHCGGGIGPNDFDALTAIEQWVEQAEAPSSIIASHNGGIGTDRTRPLCPYPQHAKYKGSGTINDATNFTCQGAPLGTGQ